jgi:tripartite ATP-independent transporter DctM subunit
MILLLGSFFVLLLLKVPISFSLLVSSFFYFVTHGISPAMTIIKMTMGIADSFPLLAVPFFILAGAIMNTGGITSRLFDFADKVCGHITGGLGHANILASIIFSGMSGTAVADTAGLGAIELKAMKDAGYDEDFSLAITGASSIIGPIIPPSVPAVVFGVIAGVSIGQLFIGGIIPGLIMGGAMSIFVYFQSKHRGYPKKKRATMREFIISTRKAFLALLTPVLIIGGIFIGVITPTEAAIIAIIYSLILSIGYKEFSRKDFLKVLIETANGTISVMLIISCAAVFGYVLAREQIPQKMTDSFLAILPNKYIALVVINLILLVAGTFMETMSAITILTPVLMPIVEGFKINTVHFGIVMILNLMVGLLTPPVGVVLYVLAGVANVPFEKIVKAIWPYMLVLTIVLFLITFIPPLVLFLPNLFFQN